MSLIKDAFKDAFNNDTKKAKRKAELEAELAKLSMPENMPKPPEQPKPKVILTQTAQPQKAPEPPIEAQESQNTEMQEIDMQTFVNATIQAIRKHDEEIEALKRLHGFN